eukprot:CAMPEP_0119478320 /NCGR_PEP_ID=MMETSP1344-20130328/8113_1 /TAXON_ID=236787 /ORGANISM="Florenciella parvula, Strain CCMP2471" /LENGTH=586 /DNA_ID=CAMNT_0007512483 /DNA_START=41 /DNA_END=1797 /DNA_ORIENTATION=+
MDAAGDAEGGPMLGGSGGIGPAWTRGEIEKPAGEKDMGSWKALVYTEEQQARLGVNEAGEKVEAEAAAAAPAIVGGKAGIGPAWTRGEIEKPAGVKDHGTWKGLVYTEEQQERLGVDENGDKIDTAAGDAAAAMAAGILDDDEPADEPKGVQAIGPAWLRGEIEKPAGVKDHGTWKGLVYTEEQQARLGVDEEGKKRTGGEAAEEDDDGIAEVPPAPFAPTSLEALLVLDELAAQLSAWVDLHVVFRDFDTNRDGTLDAAEFAEAITKTIGHDVKEATMVQLFDEVDSDHSGSISYKELVAAVEAHSSKIVSSKGDKADGGSKGVQAIGPAWTRGEIEKPAGEKDHGSYTTLVYTPEQQARLGVDEEGNPTAAEEEDEERPTAGRAQRIGPKWTRGEIERPAGIKNMGTWKALVYTEEQQARLGVNEAGEQVGEPAPSDGGGGGKGGKGGRGRGRGGGGRKGVQAIGPAWLRGEIERPAGEKDHGSYTTLMYTPEQQARLGVDEEGNPTGAKPAQEETVESLKKALAASQKDLASYRTKYNKVIEERNSFKKEAERSKRDLDKTMKDNKAVVKQLMDKLRSVEGGG